MSGPLGSVLVSAESLALGAVTMLDAVNRVRGRTGPHYVWEFYPPIAGASRIVDQLPLKAMAR